MSRAKTSKNRNLDLIYMGKEPILSHVNSYMDNSVSKAINWYHYVHDRKTGKEFLMKWIKINKEYSKEDIAKISKADLWDMNSATYWTAKMALNGAELSPEVKSIMDKDIQGAIDKVNSLDIVEPVKKINIQARTENRNSALMDLVEELIDVYFDKKLKDKESLYNFLIRHQATQSAATYIKERLTPVYDELNEKCPQIKEAFGDSLPYWKKTYKTFLSDLDQYIGNKKATRVTKPKVVKKKPVSKLIEKLQYMKDFNPLKLVSANPAEIIGANSIWTYNTKTRILTEYHTNSTDGFSIRGTTLTNIDEEKSIQKRLRKPEDHVNKVRTAGKVAIRKFMENINTMGMKPSPRINKDTIILRVIK